MICFIMFVIPGKAIYYKTIGSGGLGRGIQDPLLSFDFIVIIYHVFDNLMTMMHEFNFTT